jgi:hypothetical protein
MNEDPNIDEVLGEDVVRFSGTPEEVRDWLLENPTAQGCRVWVGATQSYTNGFDYLAA